MSKDPMAELNDILATYSQEIANTVTDAAKEVSRECANELKTVSPKQPGGGEYAKSWTTKKDGKGYVVHNKKYYRLTHLLEYGHVAKNQYGVYGTVKAYPHIAAVEDKFVQKYEERLKNDIEKIS